MTDEQLHHA
jgi:transposase